MRKSTLLQPQVTANRSCADSANLKVNREANIAQEKMSDTEDILTLEFIEVVEKDVKKVSLLQLLYNAACYSKIRVEFFFNVDPRFIYLFFF